MGRLMDVSVIPIGSSIYIYNGVVAQLICNIAVIHDLTKEILRSKPLHFHDILPACRANPCHFAVVANQKVLPYRHHPVTAPYSRNSGRIASSGYDVNRNKLNRCGVTQIPNFIPCIEFRQQARFQSKACSSVHSGCPGLGISVESAQWNYCGLLTLTIENIHSHKHSRKKKTARVFNINFGFRAEITGPKEG